MFYVALPPPRCTWETWLHDFPAYLYAPTEQHLHAEAQSLAVPIQNFVAYRGAPHYRLSRDQHHEALRRGAELLTLLQFNDIASPYRSVLLSLSP